jgi:uncharacterized protein DUF4342
MAGRLGSSLCRKFGARETRSHGRPDEPEERRSQMSSNRVSFKLDVNELGDKLKDLVHEGSVRRIIVKREGETLAEFPLTAAVVGAVLAPVLAAIGAIAALVANCTIEVEKVDDEKPGRDGGA